MRPRCICDIYDLFAPHINVLSYLLTYLRVDYVLLKTYGRIPLTGTVTAAWALIQLSIGNVWNRWRFSLVVTSLDVSTKLLYVEAG